MHWLETKVTENTLALDPTSVAVIVHAPGICVVELLELLAQATEKSVITRIRRSFFISLSPVG